MARVKLHAWLLRNWYSDRPITAFIPLTAIFIALAAFRRWAYRTGILKQVHVSVPVIVVGNITIGGTGKTPCVIWLAQTLAIQGYRPGIITRGYGGKSGYWPVPVTADTDPVLAGDEAVLLARRTRLPLMAGPDRVSAARALLEKFPVNVIVSDDGLQHYRLARVIEIIMLDGFRGIGNGWRLPAGPMRESKRRLQKADLVICKTKAAAKYTLIMDILLGDAIRLTDGSSRPLSGFIGQSVHAVAGIGNPGQFFAALRALGLHMDSRALPDHADIIREDLLFNDDLPVLMTEKDAVKSTGFNLPNHWYVPAVAHFSDESSARILRCISERLSSVAMR